MQHSGQDLPPPMPITLVPSTAEQGRSRARPASPPVGNGGVRSLPSFPTAAFCRKQPISRASLPARQQRRLHSEASWTPWGCHSPALPTVGLCRRP